MTKGLEFHFWRGALCFITNFEKFALDETEHTADEIGWENLEFGVEVADIAVVEAAGSLDLVFRVGEFVLEFQEVRVGFQIRIGFRQSKDGLERARERIFCNGFVMRACGGHGGGAGGGDFLERSRFMRGIALDRGDQVWDQVVAALQLNVDVRPSLVGLVFERNKAVIRGDEPNGDYGDYSEQNPQNRHSYYLE